MNANEYISSPVTVPKRGKRLEPSQKLKLEKAVREFESVFVGYVLKGMRNTIEKADNTNDGFGSDLLAGMFDMELAKHVSQSSNIGVARMLYKTMTGEELPHRSPLPAHSAIAHDAAQKREGVRDAAKPKPARETTTGAVRYDFSFLNRQPRQEPLEFLLPKAAVRDAVAVATAKNVSRQASMPKSLAARLNSYSNYIAEAANRHGVSENLIRAVIATESHGNEKARSHKNAKGLMQLIDSTAAAMGVKDVWDPRQNIMGGTKYLAQLLGQFDGNERLALAGYNAGPANVVKHGGVPPFRETKQYVARVMSFVRLFEQGGHGDE
jgi:soluble lytic murein transglycosylase-like protein